MLSFEIGFLVFAPHALLENWRSASFDCNLKNAWPSFSPDEILSFAFHFPPLFVLPLLSFLGPATFAPTLPALQRTS